MLTKEDVLRIGRERHVGNKNWITAFAGELKLSHYTIYRLYTYEHTRLSELVRLKVEELLRNEKK